MVLYLSFYLHCLPSNFVTPAGGRLNIPPGFGLCFVTCLVVNRCDADRGSELVCGAVLAFLHFTIHHHEQAMPWFLSVQGGGETCWSE